MHRCLAIPEIIYAICKVIRDERVFASKRYLAALARTCRTFQEPALDNLWYELGDLRPLIRCLPREAWREVGFRFSGKFLTLTRGLTKSDIQTIQRHSQRVRVIRIIGPDACGVEASTLQIIDLLHRPLFTNLRQLEWLSAVPVEIFPYLRLFLSKKLVAVDITIGDFEPALTTLINLLPSLLSPPILRHLHIRAKGNFDNDPVRFSVIAPNHDWSALRTLALPGAAVEDVVKIGDLPNLQTFMLGGQFVNSDKLRSSVAGTFPSLRILSLRDHPEAITRWLPLFRNAKLTTLFLSSFLDTGCSDRQWRKLFNNLNKNVNHGSLQTLQLQFHMIPIPTLQASDILPPLLCFTELRTFSVMLKRSLSLSYDETLELTKSWPNITSVNFTPESFERDHCSKLSSLALWAKNCPKLERLHLSVDASDRDDRLDLLSRLVTPEFNAIHSSLSTLDVGNSPITHKEFVALFLLKIFPDLKGIYDSHIGRCRWRKVMFLMSLMKASRDTTSQTLKGDDTDSNLLDWWADEFSGYGGETDLMKNQTVDYSPV